MPEFVDPDVLPLESTLIVLPNLSVHRNVLVVNNIVVDYDWVVENNTVNTRVLHRNIKSDREPGVTNLRSVLSALNQVERVRIVLESDKFLCTKVIAVDIPAKYTFRVLVQPLLESAL